MMPHLLMPLRQLVSAVTAFPTGDPKFAVKQSMPSAINQIDADPFLMCDEFGPTKAKSGPHPDGSDEGFDVGWHPHHGMDILSYIVEGKGRHADSMGNRETFDSPGFQWLSVGSGIEHAEGGGTPKGENLHGFQIWLRMPAANMEDDPRYGTVGPSEIPLAKLPGGHSGTAGGKDAELARISAAAGAGGGQVRVIAGPFGNKVGPARFAVNVQMLDVEVNPGQTFHYTLPEGMDNCMFYGFKGDSRVGAVLNGDAKNAVLKPQTIAQFEPPEGLKGGARSITLENSGSEPFRLMVFAGKKTREDIVWRGPFVCSSQEQLARVMKNYQRGKLPSKRVPWDYRNVDSFPPEELAKIRAAAEKRVEAGSAGGPKQEL